VLRGISKDQFVGATSEALKAWTSATCPHGGHPDIHATVSSLAGGTPGYVAAGPNENLVILIDENWPYDASDLGKTLLTFGLDSGELYDADVALNSAGYPFSIDAGTGDIDLVAVLTHELGHVLGLDHSDVPGATMQPEAPGFATSALRTLESDDVAGICAVYPPASKPAATASGDPSTGGCAISWTVGGHRAPNPTCIGLLMSFFAWRTRRGAARRVRAVSPPASVLQHDDRTSTHESSSAGARRFANALFRRRSP